MRSSFLWKNNKDALGLHDTSIITNQLVNAKCVRPSRDGIVTIAEAIFVRTILSGIKTIASVKKIMEFRINLLAYGEWSKSQGERSYHGLPCEFFYWLDIVDLQQALLIDQILPIASSRMAPYWYYLKAVPSCSFYGCGGWDSNPRIPKEQGYRNTAGLLCPFFLSLAPFSYMHERTCAVDRAWRPPHSWPDLVTIVHTFIYCWNRRLYVLPPQNRWDVGLRGSGEED